MRQNHVEYHTGFLVRGRKGFGIRRRASARLSAGLPSVAMVFWFAVAVLVGCGGPTDPHAARRTAEIDLVLTHGGEPMTACNVTLSADEPGNDMGGKPGPEGIVKVAAVPGRYTVVVNPQFGSPGPGGEPAPPAAGQEKIPKVVRSRTSSPWKIDVKQGKNRFEFDLDIK